jgi:dTDP-4-dehydrorhamnose reductase
MNVLVTGIKGQLGYDVIKRMEKYKNDKLTLLGVDIEDFDLTDRMAVRKYLLNFKPDVVMHCAAYTAVDKAEEDQERCFLVNAKGTEYIAEACKELDSKLVYISTDYVFEGQGVMEYEINDRTNPVNYYGLTKLKGEEIVKAYLNKYFIVRTSWAFGENGSNFVKTMLKIAENRNTISVVADQVGSPTYTADLAKLLGKMIETERFGVYHATNEGFCSWYEFAGEILRQADLSAEVVPITTEQYKTLAKRPENSRLSKRSLDLNGFERLPAWQDALSRYLKQII